MYTVAVTWFVVCGLAHILGVGLLRPSVFPVLARFDKPKRDLRELPNILVRIIRARLDRKDHPQPV